MREPRISLWRPLDKGMPTMLDITQPLRPQVGADDLFSFFENLFQGHGRGVEDDCVGSGLKWGFGTVTVAVVALFEVAEDGLFGEALLLGGDGVRCLAG